MPNYRKKQVIIEAITFEDFVEYGKNNGGNVINEMPWSFEYKGHQVTHENDECYLIPTLEGTLRFTPNDMLITGVKGEIYPCKKDIFEATYEDVPQLGPKQNLNFGCAVAIMKAGAKVAREGWNGKGMWVCLMPALFLDKSVINARTQKFIGTETDLDSQPYFVIWTSDQKWQPGWHPSQRDILAEDWMVVE